jgi:hypothetical protein
LRFTLMTDHLEASTKERCATSLSLLTHITLIAQASNKESAKICEIVKMRPYINFLKKICYQKLFIKIYYRQAR